MEPGDRELATSIVRRLESAAATVAVAESCTGGLLGAWITSVPGASTVFWGGVIAYADEAKVRLLSVAPHTLRTHGAVSENTAREMAGGVRRLAGAQWGVGITGIAGPEGGTCGKPVGTVCIAVDGDAPACRTYAFGGGRDDVRREAALEALRLLDAAIDDRG